ncbi:hypothetical protein QR321_14105 [Bacillus spizizenii]|nr:hypothetical protein QR321_14105 [Bacillus spizizenii]
MAIKLIKTYSPNENATRLKQQEQDAQTIEDALNKAKQRFRYARKRENRALCIANKLRRY